jgi:hypothetical protein
MPIIRHNKPVKQRLGNDIVYGQGQDGNVTISTTVVLSEDAYYESCTVDAGGVLFTNGFRVFCSGNLTIDGILGMPSTVAATTAIGTLVGRVADGTPGVSKTYVIGASSEAGAAQVPDSVLNDLENLIQGWNWDISGGFKRIEGGSDGDAGVDVAGSTGASGSSGNPGNPGNPATGTVPLGNPGNPGNPGTAGGTGNTGATGLGGDGGIGGGLVLIVAKTISGSGTIVSQGVPGASGATGAAGSTGTGGTSGTDGTAGTDGALNPGTYVAGDPAAYTAGSGGNPTPPNPYTPEHHYAGNPNIPAGTNPPVATPTPPYHQSSFTKHSPNYIPNSHTAHNPSHFNPTYWAHALGNAYTAYAPGDPIAYHEAAQYHTNPDAHSPGNYYAAHTGDPAAHTAGSGGNPTPPNPYTPGSGGNPTPPNPYTPEHHYAGNPNQYTPGNMDPGGTGGTGGTGGAGGAGGAGGTGGTGDAGALGGVIIVTDSTSPLSVSLTSSTYTHLQANT